MGLTTNSLHNCRILPFALPALQFFLYLAYKMVSGHQPARAAGTGQVTQIIESPHFFISHRLIKWITTLWPGLCCHCRRIGNNRYPARCSTHVCFWSGHLTCHGRFDGLWTYDLSYGSPEDKSCSTIYDWHDGHCINPTGYESRHTLCESET